MARLKLLVLVCGLVFAGLNAPAAVVREEATGARDDSAVLVTEGDFAKWLVDILGLDRNLPKNPTSQQCFAILQQHGIAPRNGWHAATLVTEGTLARVLVEPGLRQRLAGGAQAARQSLPDWPASCARFAALLAAVAAA